MTTLREVFAQLEELQWSDVVYTPPGSATLDTACLVLDPDDAEPDEDYPRKALDAGFTGGDLSVQDIRGIKRNAIQQNKEPTPEELLEAYNYYVLNDAFIDFERKRRL